MREGSLRIKTHPLQSYSFEFVEVGLSYWKIEETHNTVNNNRNVNSPPHLSAQLYHLILATSKKKQQRPTLTQLGYLNCHLNHRLPIYSDLAPEIEAGAKKRLYTLNTKIELAPINLN